MSNNKLLYLKTYTKYYIHPRDFGNNINNNYTSKIQRWKWALNNPKSEIVVSNCVIHINQSKKYNGKHKGVDEHPGMGIN